MSNKKNILVCPLDWGLGHATRCVPVISLLIDEGFEVIIGGDYDSAEVLKREFPNLKYIQVPTVKIIFSKSGNFVLHMLRLAPLFMKGILAEKKALDSLIKEHNIDAVISDNRYGLINKNVPCVFIGHQIMIKLPKWLRIFEWAVYLLSKSLISKFDRCWIPDVESRPNLSGDLSHKYPLPKNSTFVGPLTAFSNLAEQSDIKRDVLVVASGPEPLKTFFVNMVVKQLLATNLKALVVQGEPNKDHRGEINENIATRSHLTRNSMQEAILSSKWVISRSGYTTIMDMMALNKNAIFVPTPGQTEQEYLAKYLSSQKLFYAVKQCKFDLITAIDQSKDYELYDFNLKCSLKSEIDYLKGMIDIPTE